MFHYVRLSSRTIRNSALSSFALLIAASIGTSVPVLAQNAPSNTVVLTTNLDAPDGTAATSSTNPAIKKVINGAFAVEVDNGWVIYQGFQNSPTLSFFDADATGNFTGGTTTLKLREGGAGQGGVGAFFDAGGLVFAPCPSGQDKCHLSEGNVSGVGVGFGQATLGGQGAGVGGWFNDDTMTAHLTNPDQVPGSISGLAVSGGTGYAVGWDNDTTSVPHAIVIKLSAANQNYLPVSQTNLGTLGGPSSQAFGISKGATYVVGSADNGAGKRHAVYALPTATSWTDLTAGFPSQVDIGDGAHTMKNIQKSKALAANDSGIIAGSVRVVESAGGRKSTQVDVGFIYNVNTQGVTFFPFFGADVIPLKVLPDGKVVGNLEFVVPKGSPAGTLPAIHPFVFDGTNITDLGTMTLVSTGQPAFGCRVNRPNNLGEMVGTCIPNATTPYGVGGESFYINATGGGSFVNLNAIVHSREDTVVTTIKPFSLGTASSIDDEDEVTLVGVKVVSGVATRASFLISKDAYQ